MDKNWSRGSPKKQHGVRLYAAPANINTEIGDTTDKITVSNRIQK